MDTWKVIAIDAPKSTFITSIAGCSSTSQFRYIIHQTNVIFTVEALAIGMALDELVPLVSPVIILTDSLSISSICSEVGQLEIIYCDFMAT